MMIILPGSRSMRRLPGFCRNGGQEAEGPVSLIGPETVGRMRGRLRVCCFLWIACMLVRGGTSGYIIWESVTYQNQSYTKIRISRIRTILHSRKRTNLHCLTSIFEQGDTCSIFNFTLSSQFYSRLRVCCFLLIACILDLCI